MINSSIRLFFRNSLTMSAPPTSHMFPFKELKEIRLPEEGEIFGRVLKLLGGENLLVKCTDGITRRGRIRGKLKRRAGQLF